MKSLRVVAAAFVLFSASSGVKAAVVVCNVADYEVRLNSCAGPNTGFDWNLSRACEHNEGKIIVRCHRRCDQRNRVGLCTKCGWAEKKRAVCTDTGDRMKLRNCDAKQAVFVQAALKVAKIRIQSIESALAATDTGGLEDEEQHKFKRARDKAGNIDRWLNRDRQFLCHSDNGSCKDAYASAFPLSGRGVAVRLCPKFFQEPLVAAAGTIVHEASHSCCGTTDEEYYRNGKQPNTTDNWANVADTYKYWTVHGFCVPSSAGKCRVPKKKPATPPRAGPAPPAAPVDAQPDSEPASDPDSGTPEEE